MKERLTPEQLEIRKAQWAIYREAYFLSLRRDIVSRMNADNWQDCCYDAAAFAKEAITLFNDVFAGRDLGSTVLQQRQEYRREQTRDSIYDIEER